MDAVKRLIKISPKLHLENCSNFVRGYSVLRFLETAEKEGWKMNHTCVRVAMELSVYALFIFYTYINFIWKKCVIIVILISS